MAIDDTIDLAVTARPGLATIYDVKPLLRDDGTLLFTVAWRNFITNETFPGTGLVAIDTATDRVASFTISDRCQGVTWLATAADGTLYAATTPYYAALRHRDLEAPPLGARDRADSAIALDDATGAIDCIGVWKRRATVAVVRCRIIQHHDLEWHRAARAQPRRGWISCPHVRDPDNLSRAIRAHVRSRGQAPTRAPTWLGKTHLDSG